MADTLTDPTKAATMEVRYQPRANARVSSNFNPSVMAGNLQSSTPPATTWRPSSTVDILTAHRMMTEQIAFEAKLATAQKAKVDLQRETLDLQKTQNDLNRETEKETLRQQFYDHIQQHGGTQEAWLDAIARFPSYTDGGKEFATQSPVAIASLSAEQTAKLQESKRKASYDEWYNNLPDDEKVKAHEAVYRASLLQNQIAVATGKAVVDLAGTAAQTKILADQAADNLKRIESGAAVDGAVAQTKAAQDAETLSNQVKVEEAKGKLSGAKEAARINQAAGMEQDKSTISGAKVDQVRYDELLKHEGTLRDLTKSKLLAEQAQANVDQKIAEFNMRDDKLGERLVAERDAAIKKAQVFSDEADATLKGHAASGYNAVAVLSQNLNDKDANKDTGYPGTRTWFLANKHEIASAIAKSGFDSKDMSALSYGLNEIMTDPQIQASLTGAIESYKTANTKDLKDRAAAEFRGTLDFIRTKQNESREAASNHSRNVRTQLQKERYSILEDMDKTMRAQFNDIKSYTTIVQSNGDAKTGTWADLDSNQQANLLRIWKSNGGSDVPVKEGDKILYNDGHNNKVDGDGLIASLLNDTDSKIQNAMREKQALANQMNGETKNLLDPPAGAGTGNGNPPPGSTPDVPPADAGSNVINFNRAKDASKDILDSVDKQKTGTGQK